MKENKMLEMTISVDPLTESNCYILAEENHCVIIDPGESENLLRLLTHRGWEPELFLLTHEHCDHMAGLDTLRAKYPDAPFKATESCDRGVRQPRLNMSRIMEVYLYFRGKPGIHYDPFVCRPADEILPENAVLRWREHIFRFVPLPGHSPGSSGIFFDETTFFSGDYLIPDEEPILRFPGGDADAYAKITEPFLLSLPAGLRICPGHGDIHISAAP